MTFFNFWFSKQRSLNRCSKYELEDTEISDFSETYYAMDTPEQAEITDYGLVDFLQNVAFILECIVANPALYDHNNQMYHDDGIKFPIWNHICTVYYEKCKWFRLADFRVQLKVSYLD